MSNPSKENDNQSIETPVEGSLPVLESSESPVPSEASNTQNEPDIIRLPPANRRSAPPMPPAAPMSLDLNDAFTYLHQVKSVFSGNSVEYNTFLKIMKHIDTQTVVVRVSALFHKHPKLIEGFNTFLPSNCKIPIPSQAPLPSLSSLPPPPHSAGMMKTPDLGNRWPQATLKEWESYDDKTRTTSTDRPSVITSQSALPVKKGNAEFTNAVAYVKKIKNRFSNEPEVYKAFLEILHTYQKDQRSIKDVYLNVSKIFRHHPDLLAEFSQFLPDSSGAAPKSTQSLPSWSDVTHDRTDAKKDTYDIPKRYSSPPVPMSKRMRVGTEVNSKLLSQQSPEELEFFEKVKNTVGDKTVYAEFLKCLNLYSQEYLKLDEVVRLVSGFIGHDKTLFNWFKVYVGYKEPLKREKTGVNPPPLNLNSCKRLGSYRLLPKSYQTATCSGRTQLCEEVLNDALVSCPSFSSEESTFVASRKNQYEEALFKCEDERFEMDMLIEANQATLMVLEPLAQKLANMSPAELEGFELGDNLGGTSEVIYQRALKKIYGEKHLSILEGLKSNPSVAVPVVLKRLKQKDEEWRKVQREWNKVWHEVHLKNYFKALDHQGISFKTVDKKSSGSKSYVQEIETLYEEAKRVGDIESPQQVFPISDELVIEDCIKLILYYIQNSNSLNFSERKMATKFTKNFFPEFFSTSKFPQDDENTNARTELNVTSKKGDLMEVDHDSSKLVMFGNTVIFVMFRLFTVLVCRMCDMKELSSLAETLPKHLEKNNPVATALNIQKVPMEKLSNVDLYYSLFELIKQLLDGSMDSGSFEERIGFIYGPSAYIIYTVDKIIHSFVRQLVVLLSDQVCENLVRLFDSRLHSSTVMLTEFSLKVAAESVVGNKENNSSEKSISFQLVSPHSDTDAPYGSVEEKWSIYVDNFVKVDCDMSLMNPKSPLFLKRNIGGKNRDDLQEFIINYNLECKICINTYKMFFVEGSEDFMWKKTRRSHDTDYEKLNSILSARMRKNIPLSLPPSDWLANGVPGLEYKNFSPFIETKVLFGIEVKSIDCDAK